MKQGEILDNSTFQSFRSVTFLAKPSLAALCKKDEEKTSLSMCARMPVCPLECSGHRSLPEVPSSPAESCSWTGKKSRLGFLEIGRFKCSQSGASLF